jgi:hypothetical protein
MHGACAVLPNAAPPCSSYGMLGDLLHVQHDAVSSIVLGGAPLQAAASSMHTGREAASTPHCPRVLSLQHYLLSSQCVQLPGTHCSILHQVKPASGTSLATASCRLLHGQCICCDHVLGSYAAPARAARAAAYDMHLLMMPCCHGCPFTRHEQAVCRGLSHT